MPTTLTVGSIRTALAAYGDEVSFDVALEKLPLASKRLILNSARRSMKTRRGETASAPSQDRQYCYDKDSCFEWIEQPFKFWSTFPKTPTISGIGKEQFFRQTYFLHEQRKELAFRWRFYAVVLAQAFKLANPHCEKQVSDIQVRTFMETRGDSFPSDKEISALGSTIRSGSRRLEIAGDDLFWLFSDDIADNL